MHANMQHSFPLSFSVSNFTLFPISPFLFKYKQNWRYIKIFFTLFSGMPAKMSENSCSITCIMSA